MKEGKSREYPLIRFKSGERLPPCIKLGFLVSLSDVGSAVQYKPDYAYFPDHYRAQSRCSCFTIKKGNDAQWVAR